MASESIAHSGSRNIIVKQLEDIIKNQYKNLGEELLARSTNPKYINMYKRKNVK